MGRGKVGCRFSCRGGRVEEARGAVVEAEGMRREAVESVLDSLRPRGRYRRGSCPLSEDEREALARPHEGCGAGMIACQAQDQAPVHAGRSGPPYGAAGSAASPLDLLLPGLLGPPPATRAANPLRGLHPTRSGAEVL